MDDVEKDKDISFGYFQNQSKNPARTWVLVIHHEFKNTDDVREGNQDDVSKLCSTFTRRKCRFKDLKSITKEEILSLLGNRENLFSLFTVNGEEAEPPDMFILFILSHGASGGTIFTDHLAKKPKDPNQPFEEYHTDDVWNRLKGIPQLQDCVKLIFFGPCRGTSDEIRLPASKEILEKNPVDDKSMWFSVQPYCENFIIFYSTVEAVRAQRNILGTWLVTGFCEELDSITKDVDLIIFLTGVKWRICEKATINGAFGQTPQLQFSSHKKFTVSSFPMVEKTDAKSKTDPGPLEKKGQNRYYSWRSTNKLPLRRGRALIFHDDKHVFLAKEMQISFQTLDFETRLYSVQRLTKVVQEVTSVHNSGLSEDGAIVICVLARLLNNPELGLTIITRDKKVAANEITHSFIGTKSSDLAGKPKLLFFLDGGYRDDSPLIGKTPAAFTLEGNNHGEIFTFFGSAKSENNSILSGLIEELRNPELKSNLSLEEAIVNLLHQNKESGGEIDFQVVSTFCHLLTFQPCRNVYIEPTFTTKVKEAETPTSFEELVTKIKDAAMKPYDRSINHSWLLRSGAGMGKSAATNELAKRLREKLPDTFLVIHFSFKIYCQYFRELKADSCGELKPGPDWYIKFLEIIWEKDSVTSQGSTIRSKISEHDVFILADGFDEICPEYENIASELLHQLNKANVPLWITTRVHGEQSIRKKIDVLELLDMCPLTREEQIKLLRMFLCKDSEECAELLDKFNGDGKSDFTGTPMQLKMVAEIGDQVHTFDGGLNSLYHHFVMSKIEFYLEGYCGTNKSHKKYESSMSDAMDLMIELTVSSYFPNDEKLSREIIRKQHEINHIGILRVSINSESKKLESVTFEHETYAEFLLSVLFLSKCGHNLSKSEDPLCQYIDNFQLSDILLQRKFDQVRAFIDSYFLGASREAKVEATEIEAITTFELQQRKINLMSYICKEGHASLFKLFFESKLKNNFGDIKDLLNTPFEYDFRNNTYKYYPLYAACISNENLALLLLKLGARLDLHQPHNCRIEEDSTILHLAADRNLYKIVEIFVNAYPKMIYTEDKIQRTPADYMLQDEETWSVSRF